MSLRNRADRVAVVRPSGMGPSMPPSASPLRIATICSSVNLLLRMSSSMKEVAGPNNPRSEIPGAGRPNALCRLWRQHDQQRSIGCSRRRDWLSQRRRSGRPRQGEPLHPRPDWRRGLSRSRRAGFRDRLLSGRPDADWAVVVALWLPARPSKDGRRWSTAASAAHPDVCPAASANGQTWTAPHAGSVWNCSKHPCPPPSPARTVVPSRHHRWGAGRKRHAPLEVCAWRRDRTRGACCNSDRHGSERARAAPASVRGRHDPVAVGASLRHRRSAPLVDRRTQDVPGEFTPVGVSIS
jgi:hypothetical protein